MTTHLEESLQRDFDRIRALITKMAELAVRTLRDCVAAFEQRDRQLASVIILRDQRIDLLEKEIDQLCLEFILRHQPAGSHLRFAYAALQINFELERIGDYAESIARQVLKLLDLNCHVPKGLFSDISSASIEMLHNAVTAFVRQDANLAGVTAQIEERVDLLRNQATTELMHLVQSNQIALAALTPLMTIARRFERVSDQAKSMCQETIYLCTGEYAKHQGSQVYRVLLVDDHHGCPSQMGEAIGRALNRPEFSFSSAGLDPLPLNPDVISFLHSKALEIPDQKQKRLQDVPEFQQYQVVIALSQAAKRQLPPPSRKTAQFDWPVPDPGAVSGSPEEFRAACEDTFRVLSQQLSDLISAILGEEQT